MSLAAIAIGTWVLIMVVIIIYLNGPRPKT
jgi:hypothetical protein